MWVALIGGMDRLERNYINEVERLGIKLKVFTKSEIGIASKVINVDAVVRLFSLTRYLTKQKGR